MNVKEMTEQTPNAAEELQQKAGEWTEKAKGAARDVGAGADLYVREYAWTTVALAAVAAGVIGFLVGRPKKEE